MIIPELRKDIAFFDTDGSEKIVVFKNEDKRFKIGGTEAAWLGLCDGISDLDKVKEIIKHECPTEKFDAFLAYAKNIGFFDDKPTRKKLNILRIKKALCNPNDFLSRRVAITIALRNGLGIAFFPLLIVGFVLGIANFPQVNLASLTAGASAINLALFIVSMVAIMAIHELSHAIVAKSFGAPIPELGLLFLYFSPGMYVDLSGISVLKRTWHKLFALSAGIMSQVCVSSLLLIGASLVGTQSPVYAFLLSLSFTNVAVGVFNLIPFIKLDGYFIMATVLRIEHFREKSVALFCGSLARAKVRPHSFFYFIFGLLSVIFAPLFIANTMALVNMSFFRFDGFIFDIIVGVFALLYIVKTVAENAFKTNGGEHSAFSIGKNRSFINGLVFYFTAILSFGILPRLLPQIANDYGLGIAIVGVCLPVLVILFYEKNLTNILYSAFTGAVLFVAGIFSVVIFRIQIGELSFNQFPGIIGESSMLILAMSVFFIIAAMFYVFMALSIAFFAIKKRLMPL